MKVFYKSTEQCDYYFCCPLEEENKIILPENILLSEFLLFLQGSLDQLKYVVISDVSGIECDFQALKSAHFSFSKHFVFLNFSVRNSLKSNQSTLVLKSFEDIRASLENILKN